MSCPICGDRCEVPIAGSSEQHRCKPRVLRAIDGAHRRDEEDILPRGRSYAERLKDGMAMIGLCQKPKE